MMPAEAERGNLHVVCPAERSKRNAPVLPELVGAGTARALLSRDMHAGSDCQPCGARGLEEVAAQAAPLQGPACCSYFQNWGMSGVAARA